MWIASLSKPLLRYQKALLQFIINFTFDWRLSLWKLFMPPSTLRNIVLILAQGIGEKKSSFYFASDIWNDVMSETGKVCLHCFPKFPYSQAFSSSPSCTLKPAVLLMAFCCSKLWIMELAPFIQQIHDVSNEQCFKYRIYFYIFILPHFSQITRFLLNL